MHRAIVSTDTLLSLPSKSVVTTHEDWDEELFNLHDELRVAFTRKWLIQGERGWQLNLDRCSEMEMDLEMEPPSYRLVDAGCKEVLSLLNKAAVHEGDKWSPVLNGRLRQFLNEEPPVEYRILFGGPNPMAGFFMEISQAIRGE